MSLSRIIFIKMNFENTFIFTILDLTHIVTHRGFMKAGRYLLKITFIVLVILLVVGCSFNNTAAPHSDIQNGVLDLQGYDFELEGPVRLNGEWEFYWNNLLYSEDFSVLNSENNEVKMMTVPSSWNTGEWYEKTLPAFGCATYRLNIKIDKTDILYAVKMKEIFTAYRLWINGREITSCGSVSDSKEGFVPMFRPHVTAFRADRDSLEVILQVANFSYKSGGLSTAIEFGPAPMLHEQRERTIILNYILFGSLLIMGLYHLGLFSLRREDCSTLFFGLLCLIMDSRVLVTNEMFFVTLFPGAGWDAWVRTVVAGYYLLMPVFTAFLYSLYPDVYHKRIIKLLLFTGFISVIMVLVTNQSFYVKTEPFAQILIVSAAVYLLSGLIKAIIKKMDGAILVVTGTAIVLVTTINDILYGQYSSSFHPMSTLTPYGMLVFVFIQSYILSARFSNAFRIANVDELTQVFNRRRFNELTENIFEKSEKSGKTLSLLFMDLDFFKAVNDTYGHDTGDLVLKLVASEFKNSIRKGDIFARMGGEEFALMLPETTAEEARRIADRIRKAFSEKDIQIKDKTIRVTISIGISTNRDGESISLKKLSKNADQALYLAKERGRNRVEVWNSPHTL